MTRTGFRSARLEEAAADSSALAAMARAAGLTPLQCAAVARKELGTIDTLSPGADYGSLRRFFDAFLRLEKAG